METCPCGSGNEYKACCEIYHSGAKEAPTAEILMRSRYSAFATNKIKYIGETHVPGTEDFDEKEAQDWAVNSTWNKLEIIDIEKGQETDNDGMVEFKAFYSDKEGNDYVHHEVSTFKKMEGKWLYGSGQIVGTGPLKRLKPKVGRNEPCTCGSGKKFKKCCGANK